jgi:hypothetical protein
LLKLGAYDLPSVPGLSGDEPVREREEGLGIELDGLVGAGLLANFRVTLADGGRTMWLEDMPRQALERPDPALTTPVDESDDSPDDASDDDDDAPSAKPGKPGATKSGAAKPGAAKPGAKPAASPAPVKPAGAPVPAKAPPASAKP